MVRNKSRTSVVEIKDFQEKSEICGWYNNYVYQGKKEGENKNTRNRRGKEIWGVWNLFAVNGLNPDSRTEKKSPSRHTPYTINE